MSLIYRIKIGTDLNGEIKDPAGNLKGNEKTLTGAW
jgi:hypothetical protein